MHTSNCRLHFCGEANGAQWRAKGQLNVAAAAKGSSCEKSTSKVKK